MAFNGLAIHSPNVFNALAEDVSPVVSMISPFETPLLDAIGNPARSATNILHEWMEESLNPNSVFFTANLTAPAAGTTQAGLALANGESAHMMPGTILLHPAGVEYLQIVAKTATTVDVVRGYGGTVPAVTTAFATDAFTVIAEAALEGADVDTDISRARARKFNYMQIIKKDVVVSGSLQAVQALGGITNEFDHQIVQRTREAVRALEKAMYLSIESTVAQGNATVSRSMKGLSSFLTTNNLSLGGALTEAKLKSVVKAAWDQGATDIDLITADSVWKDLIDGFNATRVRTTTDDATFRNIITSYESSYGIQKILPPSRWMRPSTLMTLSSRRVNVVPLAGRTFQFENVGKTGDNRKGMVIGEYTLEIKNQEGMSQARV